MPEYKKMYSELFNAYTDVIEILKRAQIKAEEIYISSQEPSIEIAPHDNMGVDKQR